MRSELSRIFDTFGDGFLLVDPAGRVRFANEAARRQGGAFADGTIRARALARALRRARDGALALPSTVEIDTDTTATVCPSPVAGEFAVILRSRDRGPAWESMARLLMAQVQDELHGAASACAAALEAIGRQGGALPGLPATLVRALTRRCGDASSRLQRMVAALSERVGAYSIEDMQPGGTIGLGDLLDAIVGAARERADACGVTLSVDVADVAVQRIHGSRYWLEWALVELLEHTIDSARPGDSVVLTARSGASRAILRMAASPAPGPSSTVVQLRPAAPEREPALRLGDDFIDALLRYHGGRMLQGSANGERRAAIVYLPLADVDELDGADPAVAQRAQQAQAVAHGLIARLRAGARGEVGLGGADGAGQ
jgi:hypothetical protein